MTSRKLRLSSIGCALLAGLTACGGGGDDGPPATVATIDITAANRDTLSHATAAGILGLSVTGSIPLASGAGGREQPQALGVASGAGWSGRLLAPLLQPLRDLGAGGWQLRERSLAVIGPVVEACAISGSTSSSLDDRDGNGLPSLGDVLTIAFNNCKETADETLNGTTSATVTMFSQTPLLSMSMRLTTSQLSDVTSHHAVTLNGAMLLDYTQTGASTETMKVTADGPVAVTVSTHLGFSDTVTLQSGFVVQDDYDGLAALPGSTTPGRTVSTVRGGFRSNLAGGVVEVATASGAPLIKYSAEAYPRSGVVQVNGRNGTLQITALSANDVRLDLDADGNGSFELTKTESWDWLL